MNALEVGLTQSRGAAEFAEEKRNNEIVKTDIEAADFEKAGGAEEVRQESGSDWR